MSTPAKITIQPLTTSDQQTWLALWQGYQAFYKTEIAASTSQITWHRLLDPDEPMFGALALVNGEAVGLVHWIFHRSSWTVGNYCYLQDLFVADHQRGGGIGRQLIEHVYATAKAANCSRVYWLTHESNDTAMQLYDRIAERSGFVQYRKRLD